LESGVGGVVGEASAPEEFFELGVGVVAVTAFAEVFGVVDVEIDDHWGMGGETEYQPVALKTLFVAAKFSEVAGEFVVGAIGILGDDVLVSLPNPQGEFDGFVFAKCFGRESAF
jgi:hypothetical protein